MGGGRCEGRKEEGGGGEGTVRISRSNMPVRKHIHMYYCSTIPQWSGFHIHVFVHTQREY